MTEHYSLETAVYSKTAQERGVNNLPPDDSIYHNLRFSAAGLERIRVTLGKLPLKIHSWYRCEALNKLVGGSVNSQHIQGLAIDFTCPTFGVPREICKRLSDSMEYLGIDQLILEGTWVHVSFALKPRFMVLTKDVDGKYIKGIV